MSRVLLRHVFFNLRRTLCSSTTRPRRFCATRLGPIVLSRLDYCNAVLVGLLAATLAPLQSPARGGETRARPETARPCNSRPSGPVVQRIEYKLCLLVHKALIGQAPYYMNHMDANPGIKVGSSFFTDLVYADDTTLFATSSQSAVESLSSFQNAASVLDICISLG